MVNRPAELQAPDCGAPVCHLGFSGELILLSVAGTMSVFFAAMNFSKWLPYAWLGLLDLRNMSTALILLPLAPLGVWLGVWLARRIGSRWFYRIAYAGMFCTGVKLLWDGLA